VGKAFLEERTGKESSQGKKSKWDGGGRDGDKKGNAFLQHRGGGEAVHLTWREGGNWSVKEIS